MIGPNSDGERGVRQKIYRKANATHASRQIYPKVKIYKPINCSMEDGLSGWKVMDPEKGQMVLRSWTHADEPTRCNPKMVSTFLWKYVRAYKD